MVIRDFLFNGYLNSWLFDWNNIGKGKFKIFNLGNNINWL